LHRDRARRRLPLEALSIARVRLRGLLLLIPFAALPWAGWQLVKQTEALLREGQERAQIAAAQAIARALRAAVPDLPGAEAALYVNRAERAPLIDGAGDDWRAFEGTRSADGRVSLTLSEDALAFYGLLEVRDDSRKRADIANPLGQVGDRVELTVRDEQGLRQWQFGNAAPGALQIDIGGAGPIGEWQETPEGYRIEWRLPRPTGAAALMLTVIDEQAGGAQRLNLAAHDEPLPLVRADARVDRALETLVPDGGRVRFVSRDGWVLGRAGTLQMPDDSARAGARGTWKGLLYRMLLAPPAEAGTDFAPQLVHLNTPVVWQALSGIAASSARAAAMADTLIVAAAVPLQREGQVQGVLLLEQASDALLVLANRAVFGVMVASLVTVLAGSLVLFGYAGVLSWRIRRLRNAAERSLHADGRLEPNLPHLAARDDLGDLSRSFARLLGEIGAYTDYLRSLASKLSHELNTPLAIVRSSLDNLEHERLDTSARTYAQRARDGAERLAGILRSMAEASRMERAIQAAEGEDFDLAALARGCAEAYRDLAAPRRVLLDAPEGALTLHGAPDLIAQALDKLVDNARSFAPTDGWIRVRLRAHEHGVELAVANNGPPLPARMQDRLFESLVSVRQGAERGPGDAPHMGLGLFIVRLVAELHGGAAQARNLPDNGGVEFVLHITGMPRRRL
jgi:dedicated sortase system histidine kinase